LDAPILPIDHVADLVTVPTDHGSINATIPARATYDVQRRATMAFNNPSKLVDDPRGAERRLFATVPFTQQGT
jgi:para-nitrobenzyl esterase